MNIEQHISNEFLKKMLGGIREIRIWKYIMLQVESRNWQAIPDACIITADLHRGDSKPIFIEAVFGGTFVI